MANATNLNFDANLSQPRFGDGYLCCSERVFLNLLRRKESIAIHIAIVQYLKGTGELPTAKASWLPGSSSIAIRRWSYRLSPGVTSRGSRGRSVQDVDGCIDIPIMDCLTNRTLPDAYFQRHHFHLRATNRAGLRGGIPTANLFYPAAIPRPLVP